MEHIKRRPVADIVEDLTTQLLSVAKFGSRKAEQIVGNEYLTVDTGVTTITVHIPFVQHRLDWNAKLSKSATLFVVMNIMPHLKTYNMLWHRPFNEKNGQEKSIMASLKKFKLIYPTEGKDMYIVNPFVLWRGSIPGVIMATRNMVGERTPTPDMIIDLKPPEKTELRSLVEEAIRAMRRLNSNETF